MMTFHHIGVPSTQKRDKEVFLEGGKLFVTPVDADPMKIEYLRFLPDSPMPNELKTQTHLAYQVDNMDAELKGKKVLIEPFTPMPGVKVAFILHEGVPIEFMQVG
jgi:hypothetical protein